MPHTWDPTSLPPELALRRLGEGNERFRTAHPTLRPTFDASQASAPQRPIAIILGCSDARLPVEMIFDQGFGDLFVVRVAGNIVAPSIVGSIEFAASQFGTRLVVVLGHTGCGAIGATVQALSSGRGPASRNLRDIVDRIAPHIEPIVRRGGPDVLVESMRANVRASAGHLRHGSTIIEELVRAGRIEVAGAEYELETGIVRFLQ
jgi:carbonic anhydrase